MATGLMFLPSSCALSLGMPLVALLFRQLEGHLVWVQQPFMPAFTCSPITGKFHNNQFYCPQSCREIWRPACSMGGCQAQVTPLGRQHLPRETQREKGWVNVRPHPVPTCSGLVAISRVVPHLGEPRKILACLDNSPHIYKE